MSINVHGCSKDSQLYLSNGVCCICLDGETTINPSSNTNEMKVIDTVIQVNNQSEFIFNTKTKMKNQHFGRSLVFSKIDDKKELIQNIPIDKIYVELYKTNPDVTEDYIYKRGKKWILFEKNEKRKSLKEISNDHFEIDMLNGNKRHIGNMFLIRFVTNIKKQTKIKFNMKIEVEYRGPLPSDATDSDDRPLDRGTVTVHPNGI